MSIMAMEWGFRAHEKGMNLEMARIEYRKLSEPPPRKPGIHRIYNGGQTLLEDPRPKLVEAANAAARDATGRKYFTVGRNHYVLIPSGDPSL